MAVLYSFQIGNPDSYALLKFSVLQIGVPRFPPDTAGTRLAVFAGSIPVFIYTAGIDGTGFSTFRMEYLSTAFVAALA